MEDFLFQMSTFESEIIGLLDEGKKITVEELESICDSDSQNIVDYIGEKFGFKNINSTPKNQDLLKAKLSETYISVSEAKKIQVNNNGLLYLLNILFEIVLQEAYTYKWNYENS